MGRYAILSRSRRSRFTELVTRSSILIHLRDPVRALETIRGATGRYFLSSDQIELGLTLLDPRRPSMP